LPQLILRSRIVIASEVLKPPSPAAHQSGLRTGRRRAPWRYRTVAIDLDFVFRLYRLESAGSAVALLLMERGYAQPTRRSGSTGCSGAGRQRNLAPCC
jgi:hypothetical protein